MMDPEAELADFTPYNPTILLLEGHKAATSTCDNTDVLRMESPLADDTCAWNNIEALDISTDSLGETIQGMHHTQCVWLISGWPAILAYGVPSELLR